MVGVEVGGMDFFGGLVLGAVIGAVGAFVTGFLSEAGKDAYASLKRKYGVRNLAAKFEFLVARVLIEKTVNG